MQVQWFLPDCYYCSPFGASLSLALAVASRSGRLGCSTRRKPHWSLSLLAGAASAWSSPWLLLGLLLLPRAWALLRARADLPCRLPRLPATRWPTTTMMSSSATPSTNSSTGIASEPTYWKLPAPLLPAPLAPQARLPWSRCARTSTTARRARECSGARRGCSTSAPPASSRTSCLSSLRRLLGSSTRRQRLLLPRGCSPCWPQSLAPSSCAWISASRALAALTVGHGLLLSDNDDARAQIARLREAIAAGDARAPGLERIPDNAAFDHRVDPTILRINTLRIISVESLYQPLRPRLSDAGLSPVSRRLQAGFTTPDHPGGSFWPALEIPPRQRRQEPTPASCRGRARAPYRSLAGASGPPKGFSASHASRWRSCRCGRRTVCSHQSRAVRGLLLAVGCVDRRSMQHWQGSRRSRFARAHFEAQLRGLVVGGLSSSIRRSSAWGSSPGTHARSFSATLVHRGRSRPHCLSSGSSWLLRRCPAGASQQRAGAATVLGCFEGPLHHIQVVLAQWRLWRRVALCCRSCRLAPAPSGSRCLCVELARSSLAVRSESACILALSPLCSGIGMSTSSPLTMSRELAPCLTVTLCVLWLILSPGCCLQAAASTSLHRRSTTLRLDLGPRVPAPAPCWPRRGGLALVLLLARSSLRSSPFTTMPRSAVSPALTGCMVLPLCGAFMVCGCQRPHCIRRRNATKKG